MPKTDLVRRTDQIPHIRNGELVTGATVIQVSQLAMTSPFSGDFQIVDEGRLIVGDNPDLGARVIVSNSGLHGYGPSGIHTMGLYSKGDATHTGGDWFAGNQAANYISYNQADGVLGLYSPAGAGFIATRDGSLQAGNAAGAHMLWNSASRALEIRNGEDVRISLADTGDALFDGTIYASSGRIYGDMQVDAKFLVGDADGPGVTIGKFERYDSSGVLVESSEIMATGAENLPWFHVVAGGGTERKGYFHLGAPGDYAGKMTFDGDTLQVAGWIVESQSFVSPSGYVRMDVNRGLMFIGVLDADSASATADVRNYMLTFWYDGVNDAQPTHRILAYQNAGTPREQTLSIQAQPLLGNRAKVRLSSLSDQQAQTNIRAVGGYDTPSQQITEINLWAYRSEGTTFDYRRIDFTTDALSLEKRTSSVAFGGTKPDGLLMYTNGAWDPGGAGAGLYFYTNAVWKPLALEAYGWEAQTANFTAANVAYYPVTTAASAIVATLPNALSKPSDWEYTFKKIDSGAGTVVITPASTKTIDGAATYTLTAQWQFVTIRSCGSNWHIVAKG